MLRQDKQPLVWRPQDFLHHPRPGPGTGVKWSQRGRTGEGCEAAPAVREGGEQGRAKQG